MQSSSYPFYVIAEGPQGLFSMLSDFLEQANKDRQFAKTPHYILYQIGNQKALIKVDMSSMPLQIWHYDLMGRPATKTIKETIAKFLWEKTGEKERFLKQSHAKEMSNE